MQKGRSWTRPALFAWRNAACGRCRAGRSPIRRRDARPGARETPWNLPPGRQEALRAFADPARQAGSLPGRAGGGEHLVVECAHIVFREFHGAPFLRSCNFRHGGASPGSVDERLFQRRTRQWRPLRGGSPGVTRPENTSAPGATRRSEISGSQSHGRLTELYHAQTNLLWCQFWKFSYLD